MTGQTGYGRFRRILSHARTIAICGAGFALLAATGASADVCDDLRAQLRAVSQVGPGTSAQARRYAEAATRQAREIEKTRAIQRAQGCFADPSAVCQSLHRTIQQMAANLDALERQRDRLSRGTGAARTRAIEMRLERSGCNERQRVARSDPAPRTVTVIPDPTPRAESKSRIIVREGIGRRRLYDPNALGETPSAEPAVPGGPNEISIGRMPGTFRTLCVRTCDGYYFPVSFSTGFDFLQRDAQACESMCPASEAQLFFHRVPDQESEDMISLQGQPYTALPNAFLYRQRRPGDADPSCTCGTPLSTATAPDAHEETGREPLELSAIPTPADKPDRVRETETVEETAKAPAMPEQTGTTDNDDEAQEATETADAPRNVRVVGPEFLPAPEGATSPRSPDRRSDR